jgi:hypothetical protein
MLTGFWSVKLNARNPLGDHGVDGRITLNYVIKEMDSSGSEQVQYELGLTRI